MKYRASLSAFVVVVFLFWGFAFHSLDLQYEFMTRLTRISFLSVFLFSLLISTAQPVSAQSFLDLFRTKSSVEQNVSKTSKAVVNSAESGIPSLESNVDDTLLSLQTSALIMVAGPDESTTASMTPEQRRLVQERYGGGAINGLTTAMSYL